MVFEHENIPPLLRDDDNSEDNGDDARKARLRRHLEDLVLNPMAHGGQRMERLERIVADLLRYHLGELEQL